MNSIKKLALGTVLLAAVAAGAPANAATVVKGTLTANDPTFNSPNQGNPPTTTVTGTFAYDAYRFTVDMAGSYAISATSNAFNTYLGLYRGAFDPKNPLVNALRYDDDSGTGTNSLINRQLSTGVQYFAVVTSYYDTERGAYSLSVSGPGTATISAAVPEPATWAMMILGMGAVGFAMRSAKRRSDSKFDAKIKRITAGAAA